MRRILSVDCDLTVCPSDKGWEEFLRLKTFEHFLNNYTEGDVKYPWDYKVRWKQGEKPYNLSEAFPFVSEPMDYWRSLDYFQFQPLEGAVEKLKALSAYFDIVFISAHKGQHSKSKYYWLEEHFPFNSGVMLTKEKYLMNNSVVAHIDDRKDMLQKFDSSKRVLYSTPYEQAVKCDVAYTINNWESFSVKDFCNEYL